MSVSDRLLLFFNRHLQPPLFEHKHEACVGDPQAVIHHIVMTGNSIWSSVRHKSIYICDTMKCDC